MAGALSTGMWQRLRRQILAEARRNHTPCSLCGREIDYDLTGRNPLAPSVDHVIARAHGADPFDRHNLAVCHFGCNARKGARLTNRRRAMTAAASRNW